MARLNCVEGARSAAGLVWWLPSAQLRGLIDVDPRKGANSLAEHREGFLSLLDSRVFQVYHFRQSRARGPKRGPLAGLDHWIP